MVIGLLTVLSIPTVVGTGMAIREQNRANQAMKTQAKFTVTTENVDDDKEELMVAVLKNGKVYLVDESSKDPGYRFKGYYFNYPLPDPEQKLQGMVSMISDDPPALHWIYVDKETLMLRTGPRSATLGHIPGPWSWTADETFLTLEKRADLFVAVDMTDEEPSEYGGKTWVLYYDRNGDCSGLPEGKEMFEVSLRRQLLLDIGSRYTRD